MADNLFPQPFDIRSRQQMIKDRLVAAQVAREKAIPSMYNTPATRQAAQIGGLIADALGQRFGGGPKLSPDEEARATAVEAASARFKQYKSDNPNATADDLGLQNQRYLAEELLKNGDPQGIAMADAWGNTSRAQRYADRQYEALGEQVTAQKNDNEFFKVRNTLKNVWPQGSEFGSQGQTAFINSDGDAETRDPETGESKIIPKGQYALYPPQRPTKGNKFDLRDTGWTPTQIGKVRDLGSNIPKVAASMVRMQDALKDAVDNGGTVDFLGKGSGATWVSDVANGITGLARAFGSYLMVGTSGNLSTEAAADKYVREHPEYSASLDAMMPDNIRKGNTIAQQKWKAAATQLTYAQGQSNEPGARQMSDADFKAASQQVGALVTDPEAFRQISMANFKQMWDDYQFRVDTAPPEVQDLIMQPKARAELEASKAAFEAGFGKDFGTGRNPGPGLKNQKGVPTFNPQTGQLEYPQ